MLTTPPRFALGGVPFTIHILLGPESQPITEPAVYSNEIGIIYNFSSALHVENGDVGCANCAAQATEGALATGLLPLTPALIALSTDENSNFDVQDRPQTADWLKENLSWKVTTVCLCTPCGIMIFDNANTLALGGWRRSRSFAVPFSHGDGGGRNRHALSTGCHAV